MTGVQAALPETNGSGGPLAVGDLLSSEALQSIIDAMSTPVFVKDREHRFVLVNQALCHLVGRSKDELVGRSDRDVFGHEQAEAFWRNDDRVFETGEDNESEERITDHAGQLRTVLTHKRLTRLAKTVLLIGVITDITAFREAEAHARYLATHDTLSGLANRFLLKQRIDAMLSAAGPRDRCSLLIVDLDMFKQVNDAYGHAAGDELILAFGKRLAVLVRATDTVARLGGDEFAILLPGLTARHALGTLCTRIIEAARAPFEVAGVMVHVDASIGVVSERAREASHSEILRKADVALYSAKAAGRGCYRVYEAAMDEGRSARLAMERDLREAIEGTTGFEVDYQPLYSGDAVFGVEALVRWRHPRLGLLMPARFIPIAEETGLIVPLGEIVLARACRALTGWPGILLAVNVSPVQLREPDLPDRILRTVREYGLDPGRLELEITETAVLSADAATQASLRKLRQAGFRVVLDDFGTGYSSLSHLHNLEIDRIKIDQSFVSHLGQTSDSAPIVQAVVHLARTLGLKVTAEGVETEAQKEFLLETGCSDLQGHLLSPPLPEAEVAPLLAAGKRGGKDAA